MRMNAVLSNPKHPEYGQFTVPLPIPHNQYDGIMEALNAMDMGDPLARDCQMDEILGEYPILKRLEGKPVNIDELDYLAKRLDSFCYLDFIDRFEVDPTGALQPVCAPFIQPEDYSWRIHVDEQMVERYGTPEQLAEYRRQAELRGTPEHKAKNWMGSMLFHLSHANDVDQAWASSRTKEELDKVVEPFVQAKRQTRQWTQEDEAGYQLYQQETDPKKRTFRVWYLIANPRGLPKEFVQKELEFRWKLFPEKKEETK